MTYHPIIFIYFIIDWLSMSVKSGVFYFILFVLHYSSKLFNHLNHLNKTKMVFYRHNCLSYNNLLIYKNSVLYLIQYGVVSLDLSSIVSNLMLG